MWIRIGLYSDQIKDVHQAVQDEAQQNQVYKNLCPEKISTKWHHLLHKVDWVTGLINNYLICKKVV
jgi:hypothetical protein